MPRQVSRGNGRDKPPAMRPYLHSSGFRQAAAALAAAVGMLGMTAAPADATAPATLDLGKAAATRTPLQSTPPDTTAGGSAPGSAYMALYLEVTLNGRQTQTIVSFYQKDGHLLADVADLYQIGLETGSLENLPALKSIRLDQTQGGTVRVTPLDQVPGLSYHYDASKQTIDLVADDRLVPPTLLGDRPGGLVAAAPDSGLVFNYDAFLQGSPDRDGTTTLSVANEERLFNRFGIFSNTGVARAGGELDHYTRLDSLWHDDDERNLTTIQAGDSISSSLNWSRAVRLGGFQFRRNFALRPDLITFPVPTLSGSAAVPSSVDLYVNNIRQFSGQVPSGPFIINNPVALTGGGQARLVVRDELGREVSTTLPIYVDNRMVARGLSNYSVETGFLRRNYGASSFDYGATPSASGSYRYGWSDALTFESHGEATAGLYNAGLGGLLRLGQWGVVNAALAGNVGRTAGTQGSVGYQLILPRVSFIAQTTRNFSGYRDLAAIGGTAPPRIFDQINLSMPILATQSIGISYIHTQNIPLPGQTDATAGTPLTDSASNAVSRTVSLTYTAQLTNWCNLFANAYQNVDASHSRGFWFGASLNLGHRLTGFIDGGRNSGQNSYGASLVKTSDYNGGWNWGVQDNEGDQYSRLARAGYLGRYGQLSASAQDSQGQTLLSLEADGGLIFMDGVLEPSRHIYDSFALVSTDGIAGIPVLNENRVMGNTDRGGHLLIPDLNSYQHNHLEIDSMVLPVDASIPVTKIDVAPRSQAGVLAHFAVQRYTAATVILVDAAGQPLPTGTLLKHQESGHDFVVGYDGQAFIENLDSRNHLTARGKNLNCIATFDYAQAGGSTDLPTIGPVTCKAAGAHTP